MVKVFSRHKKFSEEAQVNLTPLIDVVFVILIMFILVAPLLEVDNIKLASQSRVEKEFKEISKELIPITIQVYANNLIKYNQIPVNLLQLKELLKEAKIKHPHVTPRLLQDKTSSFGTYQSIKNILEEVGFHEMDVVLQSGN